MAVSGPEYRTCSCGVRIVMLRHIVTGRRAPIEANPAPVGAPRGINAVVDLESGRYLIGDDPKGGTQDWPVHHPHFGRCPHSHVYRQGQRT